MFQWNVSVKFFVLLRAKLRVCNGEIKRLLPVKVKVYKRYGKGNLNPKKQARAYAYSIIDISKKI